MYKITISKDRYHLYRYDPPTGMYNRVKAFEGVLDLVDYTENILNGVIKKVEIVEAFKEISDTDHNTMEFGVFGYFTVSYNDKSIEF